jgi:hypothetical protein
MGHRPQVDDLRFDLAEQGIDPSSDEARWLVALLVRGEGASSRDTHRAEQRSEAADKQPTKREG